jgi:amino acid adenylation domain-containing protein
MNEFRDLRHSGRCVHEIFEEQARRTPNALALTCRGSSLTYDELNIRANQLAHYLIKQGIGPGDRVGLRLPRSSACVMTMLAVLKAGAAYLPLESIQPRARLNAIAKENRLRQVITDGGLRWDGAGIGGTELGSLPLDQMPSSDPRSRVNADDVMNVIYTSGSTGKPKGTEIPHRGVSGFFMDEDYASWGPGAVSLHHSALSWDGHTLDIYPALLTGGRVEIHQGAEGDPMAVASHAAACGATVLLLTATAFNTVIDIDVSLLKGLRYLMIGGEALSTAHVARAMAELPGTRIINAYGPAECAVVSCVHSIRLCDTAAPSIPIGRPVGDRAVYLLDEAGDSVPDGSTGEVCVGGPAVALGYVNRAALTAERFVPDPFSGELGTRLYRTGDLARSGPDGVLEFVGRIDDQVKIRGFRVEPAEVATVLRSHPSVLDAAVVPHRDQSGRCLGLFAYIVTTGRPASVGELRSFLRTELPEVMVPSAIMRIDRLPLTGNGKLDRMALPTPGPRDRMSGPIEHAAPETETEKFLATTWEELLKISPISLTHDFFDLGGQSLLAAQLMSRISRKFGIKIPLHLLYESSQLAQFASVLDRLVASTPAQVSPAEPRITPIPRETLRRPRAGR